MVNNLKTTGPIFMKPSSTYMFVEIFEVLEAIFYYIL